MDVPNPALDTAVWTAGGLHFSVSRVDPGWPALAALEPAVVPALAATIARADLSKIPASAEASIVLSDDAAVRALNRRYRGKDRATNVLSFPANPDFSFCDEPELGDIVLARETVAEEAQRARVPFEHHVTHLTIHGFLHLVGYRHDEPATAETMESIETMALQAVGIADPYRSDRRSDAGS